VSPQEQEKQRMTAPTADEVRRLVAAAQGLVGRATALLVAGEGLRRLGRQQLDRLKAARRWATRWGWARRCRPLAAISHLAAKGQRRFLVVCPASVQINWLNETEKHTDLPRHSLHGADRDIAGREWLRDGGVAVTTFDTLKRLADDIRSAEIAMFVVDEPISSRTPTPRGRGPSGRSPAGRSGRCT
jgi:hypothetical protein